ncbi:DUF5060 domain-containing protein [Luteolibacter arcticus]|uniref:DUF5060 domain-containing protein n=1 Tax=Luteolibacter arcticus TaxID=1581411 RepID=A0ABT3GP87_9BACT|nr:DUF5060 domain-containing protein [Luteolibacter arcticus]MCW1925341.1 DUF5060 domain-containing protein [Luteolibacter arcticus]
MKRNLPLAWSLTAFLPFLSPLPAEQPKSVERWDVLELTLSGPSSGNPFVEVQLSARFTKGEETITVPGFYDGGGVYRVRFSPPDPGRWTYTTRSNQAELSGKDGSFEATAATGDNHGPVRIRETFHLAYADGTPFFQVGTTCYAWTHQTDELQKQTLETLATEPFNKLRMCVFPKSYRHNANDPTTFPFARAADGKAFDFERFDPANWRHLEQRIGDLRKLGIEADLILFHPYDRWGFAEMDSEADDRYLRYAIARLSAYRNVWWSAANEYDFMIPPLRDGQRGNKRMEDWDRILSILEKEDPHHRLRGIHHASKLYDHSKPWVTHVSVQHRDPSQILKWRERFQKPVVLDECRYEGNISASWGKLTGPEMLRQFWVGTVCGGYVGHGETLRHPQDVLWWSKGGVLRGESPPRIAFLRKTMEALPYAEMTPARLGQSAFALSKPGSVYLVYATAEGPVRLQMEGEREYEVDEIDTWNMSARKLQPVKPGEFSFTAPHPDYLLRIRVPSQQ